jgi:pimeloyl-ACP methyl ester carboxylesterase
MQLQTELSNLSTDSKHIVASEAGHDIPVEAPDLIIEAIRDLVARTADHAS